MKSIVPLVALAGFLATGTVVGADQPEAQTAAGWVKSEKSPVLGGSLGTCFDIAVLREDGRYRMWFSWRPKKSIALTVSERTKKGGTSRVGATATKAILDEARKSGVA
jgi:hypothetical protein